MNQALKIIPNKVDKSILLTHEKPHFSLIWLHGLGDTSAGFLDYFQQPQSPVFKGGRVKLLHAPIKPVTINGGMVMPSWYDIKVLNPAGDEKDKFNFDELKESLENVDKSVTQEIAYWRQMGIKGTDQEICKRIFVGGLSQGCVTSLLYALTAKRLVGGILGFSGYLIQSLGLPNKEKLPMLIFHGEIDELLRWKWVQPKYKKHLQGLPNFNFRLFPDLTHSVNDQELSESTKWMLSQLQASKITP